MGDARFTGELRHDPRVLLGPGPSNLHPRVFRAMASPILGYLDPDFLAIMDHTMALLRHSLSDRQRPVHHTSGHGDVWDGGRRL